MIDSGHTQPSQLHSGKLIRLKTLLSHARGFNALVSQHNNPAYRDSLIHWLVADYPEQVLIDLKDFADFSEFEQSFEQEAAGAALVHIINLESLTGVQQQAFYRGLNYHREHLAEVAKNTTVLFWLPEPMIRDLALKAPDFWAWREQVFDFSLPVEMPEQRWAANYENTSNLGKKVRLKRIREILDYLQELPEDQSAQVSTADLRHELGNLYQHTGDLELAKEQLHSALAIFRELDDKHAYARVLRDITDIKFSQGNPTDALNTLEKKILPWFVKLGDAAEQSATYDRIANIIQDRGQLDEALAIRQSKQLPICEQLGDVRAKAITMMKITDILKDKGQLDEALKTLQDKVLPAFEKLNDVRSKAFAMGKIADILQLRGQLDEALAIRQNDELPIYKKLGDVREKAITMGQIADILQARGQLDEALNIRNNEELPVYKQLGDAREEAVTTGKIADILQARGQLDEALSIRQNDELPVYEQLGDVREKALTMGKIADILQARGQLDESLKIRKEEHPIYEQLGDVRSLLIGRAELASLLWQMDSKQNIQQIQELLTLALADAQRLQIPEAEQIENIMQQMGIPT